jgi:two-component system sensor histidine kinase KdpD
MLGYLQVAALVALATLLGYLDQTFLTASGTRMLYLLCVVLGAIFWGLGPSLLACVLGVLAYDLFFVTPYLSFGPLLINDITPLVVMILISLTISYLTSRVRSQAAEARRHELETHTLYRLSRKVAATHDLEVSINAIIKSVKDTLGYDMLLFLPSIRNNKTLKQYPESAEPTYGKDGITAAAWCFQHQRKAGYGTHTLPDSESQYVPLMTVRGAVGVMALSLGDASSKLTAEQERLLDAFADLAAVTIERIAFAEETLNMKISQAATEKLQTTFLDSISHDLRTPITSVLGVLSSLQEDFGLDDTAKKRLIQVARGEAERLNNSITNLLDISRIQAGAIVISRQPSDVNDIINVTLDELGCYSERIIRVDVAAGLPLVSVGFALIVRVLFNLIDNAVKYSPLDSPIDVGARQVVQGVEIEVADRGVGISPQDLPYIFHRFYRVPHTDGPGAGLGLSICKGIMEVNGGQIAVENRPGGGTIIKLILPVDNNASENKG